jgi:hypothetical protein
MQRLILKGECFQREKDDIHLVLQVDSGGWILKNGLR